MNRSRDLDTIAPDDPIENGSTSESTPTSSPEAKTPSSAKANTHFSPPTEEVYTILGHTSSPFSSFLVRPKVFDFSERDNDEEILLALRPHWFTNVSWILTAIAMLFVPLLFSIFDFLGFLPIRYQMVSMLFWYLVTFIFAFEKFLSWYFDVYMITNERVVDIDFNNMLNKKFAEADLDVIQDVSSSVKGLAGTMFNYGNVLIQTAAEQNELTFEKVPNPERIIKLLAQLREEKEHHALGGKQ